MQTRNSPEIHLNASPIPALPQPLIPVPTGANLNVTAMANGDGKMDGIGEYVLCRRRIVGALPGAAAVGMALAVFAPDRVITTGAAGGLISPKRAY